MNSRLFVVAVVLIIALGVLKEVDAGFGCPDDEYACNGHCQSINCRAGYCDAFTLWFRCTCTGCETKTNPGVTSSGVTVSHQPVSPAR